MSAMLKALLREFVVTLDALFGGDHRRCGHLPPTSCEPPTRAPEKPGLATGGIVRKPVTFIVGERGPERIVPLSGRNAT